MVQRTTGNKLCSVGSAFNRACCAATPHTLPMARQLRRPTLISSRRLWSAKQPWADVGSRRTSANLRHKSIRSENFVLPIHSCIWADAGAKWTRCKLGSPIPSSIRISDIEPLDEERGYARAVSEQLVKFGAGQPHDPAKSNRFVYVIHNTSIHEGSSFSFGMQSAGRQFISQLCEVLSDNSFPGLRQSAVGRYQRWNRRCEFSRPDQRHRQSQARRQRSGGRDRLSDLPALS